MFRQGPSLNVYLHAGLVLLIHAAEGFGALTVSENRLENHILSAFQNPRSHNQPREKEKTRNYIYQFLKDLPYKEAIIANQTFQYQSTTGVNFIYTLPGRMYGSSRDTVLLLGAHYDSVPSTPGVNDNGSGMAALLEAMNVLSGAACQRHRTLVFVAFDFEEYYLTGSFKFVNEYLERETLKKSKGQFEGAVILETMLQYNVTPGSQRLPSVTTFVFPEAVKTVKRNGYRGNFLVSAGRHSDLDLTNNLYEAYNSLPANDDIYLLNLTMPKGLMVPDLMRSDHFPFWLANKTAIFLTDSANFRGYMKTCYHQACDDVSRISRKNLRFLAKTTQAIVNMFKSDTVPSSLSTCLPLLWMILACFLLTQAGY